MANYLVETNVSSHTFRPCIQRSFRIVTRNLHHSTLSADILFALLEEHIVRQIHMVKKINCALPDLKLNDSNQINDITSLLHTKVVTEKPNKTKYGPP